MEDLKFGRRILDGFLKKPPGAAPFLTLAPDAISAKTPPLPPPYNKSLASSANSDRSPFSREM
ncbi:MAG: hypothetical protein KGY61_07055, partial [Desulfobacterales bacterium]|nr:hypothetical protein [Desulfobacterales bacterium]